VNRAAFPPGSGPIFLGQGALEDTLEKSEEARSRAALYLYATIQSYNPKTINTNTAC